MSSIKDLILTATKASDCQEVEVIQSLWSGYGKISRYILTGSDFKKIVVKNIIFPTQPNHPRGWNTNVSHERKVKSYQIETVFYNNYNHLCDNDCRTPQLIGTETIGAEQVIILEDLDAAGFPVRKIDLTIEQVKVCLKWLANFHATFLGEKPENLWETGTYWHLSTRSDEFIAMNDTPLKQVAKDIDQLLNNCKYQTLVHGDAKVANFCFSKDLKEVAAVDFQYVGGGCGIKDVAYLMGSCLSENECERYEQKLLDYYFNELKIALDKTDKHFIFKELEKEWRDLYPIAWADFTRFLLGWMPTHQKINSYSKKMIGKALKNFNY
ncbi:MAG: DUF1679 domain-containing protein [Flavobacteriales bacterium]|nr:DUF1679 domain-containing protein [Flavobacteriales bacterium]